jgi:peptidoglycan/LPS O-acetylase OafA/YrhL
VGLLRLSLSVAVVATHSAALLGVVFLDGTTSIQIFYVISGFLIFFTLRANYLHRTMKFYLNRILKIYPTYFAALIFSVMWFKFVYNSHHNPYIAFEKLRDLNIFEYIYLISTNLFLVGTDTTRFTTVTNNGHMTFFDFSRSDGFGAHNLLFVPQSWTLTIELLFYVIAPFLALIKKRTHLFTFLICLVALEEIISNISNSANLTFSNEDISVFQLKFFLVGAIASTFCSTPGDKSSASMKKDFTWIPYLLTLLFLYSLIYHLELNHLLKFCAVALISLAFLPRIFDVSINSKFDRYLGDLSFPIYVFHYPFAKTMDRWTSDTMYFLITLILTLSVSILYLKFYKHFFDKRRIEIRNG